LGLFLDLFSATSSTSARVNSLLPLRKPDNRRRSQCALMRRGTPPLASKSASKGPGIKTWRAFRSGAPEPVLDIGLGFILIHRTNVTGGDHALTQLLHLRALHDLPELRLADQETLQQGLCAKLEIRQHAQLFNRPRRQVLRLVDNQQATLALAGDIDQKASRASNMSDLPIFRVPTPKAAATMRKMSSASSCVLTS
jgi:hypothetical protein